MSVERLQQIVSRIYDLPTLPVVINKLTEVVGDPKSCADDIAKIIATDQALTGKILKMVNSAFYGLKNPINSVSLAVVILGYKSVRSLALGVSVIDMFEAGKEPSLFNIKDFWEHSLATGLCAKIIATKTKKGLPEEQFVCGLLHDTGEILLYKHVTKEFNQALELIDKNKNLSLIEAEQKILEVDHTDIGEWLSDKWRLSSLIKNCIKNHHSLDSIEKIPDKSLLLQVAMICFADRFVKQKGFNYGGEKSIEPISERLYNILDLNPKDDNLLSALIDEEMEKAKTYLKLDKGKGVSLSAEEEEKK